VLTLHFPTRPPDQHPSPHARASRLPAAPPCMEVVGDMSCPLWSYRPSTDELLPASVPTPSRTSRRYGLDVDVVEKLDEYPTWRRLTG
jgi:hypothetical protein